VGIEPTTEGLWGGGNRSDWSRGGGFIREPLSLSSGGVGSVRWRRAGMSDETWDSPSEIWQRSDGLEEREPSRLTNVRDPRERTRQSRTPTRRKIPVECSGPFPESISIGLPVSRPRWPPHRPRRPTGRPRHGSRALVP
jgi:hypothetical protein